MATTLHETKVDVYLNAAGSALFGFFVARGERTLAF